MKIAFIFNHPEWGSIPEKVKNICSFFSPVGFESTIFNTYFDTIPFTTVTTSDGHQGNTDTVGTAETIASDWYEKNITPLSNADIIVFCITRSDGIGHITPVGIDDTTRIVIFGTNEFDRAYVNGVDIGNEFEVFAEHEISHALYYLNGKQDKTHQYFYSGNPSGVLPDFILSRTDTIRALIRYCLQAIGLLKTLNSMQKNPTLIYDTALALKGKHLTLDASVPNEYGCAEAISYVLKKCGYTMPENGYAGTIDLYSWLKNNFTEISTPDFGSIIISVTQGNNHGHVGIIGHDAILSNDSQTGLFQSYWSIAGWKEYFINQKGLVTKYFINK